jgi:hypothetical protein
VLAQTQASANTQLYAGDGTINPSVLGGGGNSPDKFEDHPNSPVRRNRDGGALSRTTDEGDGMDHEEEEHVMGLLFEHMNDDDFVPGLGKGKARAKAEWSLWMASSIFRTASALLPLLVRGSGGRAGARHLRRCRG